MHTFHWLQRWVPSGTLGRVMQLFAPYWRRSVLVLLAIFSTATLGLIPPLLTGLIIDQALPQQKSRLLIGLVLAMLGAAALAGLLSVGQSYLATTMGQWVMRDLRVRLYAHLQTMSLRFYTIGRTGEIMSRLSNDVNGVQAVVTGTLTTVLSQVITIVTTLVVMLQLSLILTLLALALVPCFLFPIYHLGRVRRRLSTTTQEAQAGLATILAETLSPGGALLIKSFGRQQDELKRVVEVTDRLMAIQIRQTMITRWYYLGFHLVFAAAPALLYLVGGWRIIGGTLSVGSLVAFVALQARLFMPLKELLDEYGELQAALALFDRLFATMDQPVELIDKPGAAILNNIVGHLRFRHVGFRYDPSRPTLINIDFEAYPGQLIALVGPSGAGKTTIMNLLPRFYDVDEGAVEIDGLDVRDVTLSSLARHIGLVTQDIFLWHNTIRENIRYGRPNSTEEEVVTAARTAQLHDWVTSLSDGYDTVVGERGYRLSGGEKQRLAIARVLLMDPQLVVLDEATSALDTYTERLLQSALQPLLTGRTVLAIAHRLSTILAADQILVIDAGSIVERGTHAELLTSGGIYARLYREQFECTVSPIEAPER